MGDAEPGAARRRSTSRSARTGASSACAAGSTDFKLVKDVFGGTVNDVVLTAVAGGLRTWLRSRGVRTEGLELRALVPGVAARGATSTTQLGNRIAAMRGPLPVYIADPVERLRTVRAAMGELKESKQALGAEVLAGMQNFAPPTILGVASRLNFSTRLFNLIVTNVPGPQLPLYVLGREMQTVFPIAFLPREHALAIAIISYNGWLNFGLLGDYDALPDLEARRRDRGRRSTSSWSLAREERSASSPGAFSPEPVRLSGVSSPRLRRFRFANGGQRVWTVCPCRSPCNEHNAPLAPLSWSVVRLLAIRDKRTTPLPRRSSVRCAAS